MSNPTSPQFSPALLSLEMLGMLPKDYTIRPLQLDDYDRGYLETLAELTTVGNITKDQFRERFEWLQRRNEEYMCIVLYEHQTDRIVGSGNILIERKFIHGCSSVGHIEDIVVSESLRGKGLGQWIIKQLTHIGTSMGAYKILLACADTNVGFYKKCGFQPKEISMAIYNQ